MSITAIDTVTVNPNFANKNIDSLMMVVMLERSEQLETTVRLIAQDIQKANQKMKELHDVKSIVTSLDLNQGEKIDIDRDISDSDLATLKSIFGDDFDIGKDASTSELAALKTMLGDRFDDLFEEEFTDTRIEKEYYNSSGTGGYSGATGSGDRDVTVTYDRHHLVVKNSNTTETANMHIDGEISSLNSMSQMAMVELQSTMDKYNNAYSVASNFYSKNNSSVASITSNIR